MKRKLLFTFLFFSVLSVNTIFAAMNNLTVARLNPEYVYTGVPITPSPLLRDGLKSLRKDADYTLEYKNNVNVGTATVVVKGIGNYTGEVTKEFKITKARVIVNVDNNLGKLYGQPEPKLTYKITQGEMKGTDALKGALERQPGEDVGTYVISQGTLAAGDNYDLVVMKNNFKIDKAVITVKPTAGQSKTYGQQTPDIKYTITEGALVGKDALTGSLGYVPGENVGTYAITLGTLSAGKNYDIRFEPANFEIVKADIAVKPDAGQSKIYGAADPAFTFTITSGTLQNNEMFRGALSRQPGEDVGKYTIQQGTLGLSNNYNLKVDETVTFEVVRKSF